MRPISVTPSSVTDQTLSTSSRTTNPTEVRTYAQMGCPTSVVSSPTWIVEPTAHDTAAPDPSPLATTDS
jgi:hypothetical protein